MKKLFNNFNTSKKLGLTALVLGIIALFAGSPYNTANATINNKELAIIVEKQVDHVNVDDLADWIIQGKSDYRLIDLNEPAKFEEYHIPTAENLSITDLPDADLMRNEKIILYSDGGIHSAQAWMLLKAKGYKAVYMLLGGLEEWKESILFPALPEEYSKQDSVLFEKKKEISLHFGGVPQSGTKGTEVKQNVSLPKIQMPSGNVPAGGTKKKKKEGC